MQVPGVHCADWPGSAALLSDAQRVLPILLPVGATWLLTLHSCLPLSSAPGDLMYRRKRVRSVQSGEFERFRMVVTKSETGQSTVHMTIFHMWCASLRLSCCNACLG